MMASSAFLIDRQQVARVRHLGKTLGQDLGARPAAATPAVAFTMF
jgi:hypothetical protein